jgi:hypothetical protein
LIVVRGWDDYRLRANRGSGAPLGKRDRGKCGDSDRAAIVERLSRIAGAADVDHRRAALDKFLTAIAGLPILDKRSPDEIIGFGPDGLPE